MPDELKPVEHSTEPPMLPVEGAAPPVPLELGRDEAAETGTVENDEMEELLNPKRKRAVPEPPVDPPVPPRVVPPVGTTEPASWLWWVAFGALVVGVSFGVLYVLRARRHEAPGRVDGTDGAPAAPAQPTE